MGIFFIILIIIFLCWPWITKWLRGYMARRAEDMVRRMAGMPSRKEEQKRRREQERQQKRNGYSAGSTRGRNRGSANGKDTDSIRSMQEYAEDVEFTETKEYSETEIIEDDGKGNRRIYRESQVSDAEYIEIKK